MASGGKPQQHGRRMTDEDSGLVVRTWTSREDQKRGENKGNVTEEPLIGKEVKAEWMGHGEVRRAEGKVIRNAVGKLVIKSRAGETWQETEVPREANVDVIGR